MDSQRISYEEKLTLHLKNYVDRSPINAFKRSYLKDDYKDLIFSDLNMFQKADIESKFVESLSLIKNPTHLIKSHTSATKDFCTDVLIFGAGGVTSWFLPQLIKIYYNLLVKVYGENLHNSPTINIILVDGDKCETKNLLRQNFIPEDVGINKAEVLSKRYSEVYPKVKVTYIDKYFYHSGFFDFIEEEVPEDMLNESLYTDFFKTFKPSSSRAIINLVDNELTKHMIDYMISNAYSQSSCYMSRYFSVGCDVYNGTVYSTLFGDSLYSLDFKESTFKIDDGSIHQESCAEVAEVQTVEQTFDSNTMGANILATLFSNYIANPLKFETQKVEFTSTAQPSSHTVKKSDIDVIKLKFMIDEIRNYKMSEYLSRYGEFKATKLGNTYKSFDDFFKQYLK